ncbi:hypothetical protein NBRGN_109_00030 [Nocardia brasiliensis NBRC 14402]|uniref:DUF4267 domain-containing protein n=1 Tax=Nocardia brasiliensis TaxID=37326 RepID=UPI000307FC1A|nr:DUF4267 domain-containing protein [Nocardia brasiliensis]ASF11951.1 DUF4267 domain-containing protein [Nocardia brasiliensis]GAJ86303.1 hypothetical protein NBRGN_109_00030 [Nocardia brasiliensis NBRC 14402]SUB09181.1 Uncharacterised protein [Nocardia brasiliensis]
MTISRIATAFSLAGAAFILYIGISYLFTPGVIAPGFGLPAWPDGEEAAFLNLKGVRDTVFGVLILVLLAMRQRYALGIVTLVVALVPVGDMLTALRWHGSTAAAFGIHGLTAVFVAATGALLLLEHRLARRSAPARALVTA